MAASCLRPTPAATRSPSCGSAPRRPPARRRRGLERLAARSASRSTAASCTSPTAARAAATTRGSGSTLRAPPANPRIDLSPCPTPPCPGHVLISPDGIASSATRVGPNAGPSFIDGFRIRANGRLDRRDRARRSRPSGSARSGAPSRRSHETSSSSRMRTTVRTPAPCPSYDVGRDGALTAISGLAVRRQPDRARAGSRSAPMAGPCSRSTPPCRRSPDTRRRATAR